MAKGLLLPKELGAACALQQDDDRPHEALADIAADHPVERQELVDWVDAYDRVIDA